MCAAIKNPAKCELCAVIRFFTAKGYSAAAIHCELCAVYGPKVMSEGVLREWVCLFKSGRGNVLDEERSGRPLLVTDKLVHLVDSEVGENQRSTMVEFSTDFPEIFKNTLYEIVTARLGYRKLNSSCRLSFGCKKPYNSTHLTFRGIFYCSTHFKLPQKLN